MPYDRSRLYRKNRIEAIYDKELRGEHGFRVVVTGEYEQVLLEKR